METRETRNQQRQQARLNARAYRAARRAGLVLTKSRRRIGFGNAGGFCLIDPSHGGAVAGWDYDLAAEDVMLYCAPGIQTS